MLNLLCVCVFIFCLEGDIVWKLTDPRVEPLSTASGVIQKGIVFDGDYYVEILEEFKESL